MLHCAEALANAGRNAEAAEEARRAWVAGIGDEAGFLRRWSGAVRPDDHWERFQRLVRRDPAAAARQVPRLDPQHRAAAEARLALQRDAPNADALVAALPESLRRDPGMVLDRARWLRRADRTADALALWRRAGEAAQSDAPADDLAAFWIERNLLARRLLHDGDAAGAYALAGQHGRITPEQIAGRRVPGGLHRAAPAERSGRGNAAFHCARRSVQGGDHPGPRALLARPGRRGRWRRSEAGIRTRGGLGDHLLWPACRARAGRRCRGAGAPHHRAARSRLYARPGAGIHRPRGGARRRDAGRLERSRTGHVRS